MTWYAGIGEFSKDSPSVVGISTGFARNVSRGDALVIRGSQYIYQITNVASDTLLSLDIPPDVNGSHQFVVIPVLGYDKALSDEFNLIRLRLEKYLSKLDELDDWIFEPTRKAIEAAEKAELSELSAATSETNAKESELAAATSETNAASSASASETSETNAKASELAAATSETNAKASELAAATSETNAKASELAAATSETNAKESELAAATSETNAKASELAAATSETNAASSASAAETSETNAKASELAAATSETNAASSASAAETSETNAKESELAAQYYASIAEGATGSVFMLEAGSDIPSGAFVQIVNGLVHPATGTIVDGFVIEETLSGAQAEVSLMGSMHSNLTGLIPGSDYWLVSGQPSPTPPTSGIMQKIGTAVTSSKLLTISPLRIVIRP